MKKLLALMLVIILLIGVTGCGKKTVGNEVIETESDQITDSTKVTNLSESYSKFIELKSRKMEKLNDKANDSQNFMLSMSLLGLSTIDLIALPATICGLDESSAKLALATMYAAGGATYKDEGNKYTITYTDSDGEQSKYIANYDPSTDSAQMYAYAKDKLSMISEYTKIDNGYATQSYIIGDDGKYSIYKVIFTEEDISAGIFESDKEPGSIYKKNSAYGQDWTKGGTVWIEGKGDTFKGSIDGEDLAF